MVVTLAVHLLTVSNCQCQINVGVMHYRDSPMRIQRILREDEIGVLGVGIIVKTT